MGNAPPTAYGTGTAAVANPAGIIKLAQSFEILISRVTPRQSVGMRVAVNVSSTVGAGVSAFA